LSKPNRRRQRHGTNPSGTRPPGSTPPPAKPSTTPPTASSAAAAGTPGTTGAEPESIVLGASAATTAGAAGATGATATKPTGTTRPGGVRPSTSARAGRRERARAAYKPSIFERYRTVIVVAAVIAGIALIVGFVGLSAASPAYACTNVWTPAPTASPGPSQTPNLGYVQPDMGRTHVAPGTKVTYTYCAPASGSHYIGSGIGPIQPRVYGPSDTVIPEGWIHNLEHGGMVILYRGDSAGATPEGQVQLHAFYDQFPNSPVCNIPKGSIGPVIARFDQMSSPFQAIVWGRVLPLDTFDQAKILAYWQQWGERTNPEQQCAAPSPSAEPSTSAAPSASASAAPSATATPSPSPAPSAAPTESTSAAPSPSAS
jgi:hypothetical protein